MFHGVCGRTVQSHLAPLPKKKEELKDIIMKRTECNVLQCFFRWGWGLTRNGGGVGMESEMGGSSKETRKGRRARTKAAAWAKGGTRAKGQNAGQEQSTQGMQGTQVRFSE